MNYAHHFEKLKEVYDIPETSGYIETHIPSVRFFWSTEHVPRAPLPFTKGIVIIGQGRKVGYLNEKVFQYDANHYLISSVPTAYECETFGAQDSPVLGILIDIDLTRLHRIIEKIERYQASGMFKERDIFSGVQPVEISPEMQSATEKLLTCLKSPMDSDVLGSAFVDEILYRAALGDHGHALFALTKQNTHYARISHSLTYIHGHYKNNITVNDLAAKANMSVSSFHRTFKGITGESPLQYLKKVRLHKARFLLIRDGLRVSSAATEVGYESLSQFTREFKRHFHVLPSAALDGAYATMYCPTSAL